MAGGFFSGLVQGTLLCGAALAALSLALPVDRPQDAGGVAAESAADRTVSGLPGGNPAATESVTPGADGTDLGGLVPIGGADNDAANAPDAGTSGAAPIPTASLPAAESLTPPAGSEFARGADIQPAAPLPLEPAARSAEGPVSPRPEAEAPPRPAALQTDPPSSPPAEAPAPRVPTAPATMADVPQRPPAPAAEHPAPVALPGRVATPGADRAPGRGASDPVTTGDAEVETITVPLGDPAVVDAEAIPSAPAPSAPAPSMPAMPPAPDNAVATGTASPEPASSDGSRDAVVPGAAATPGSSSDANGGLASSADAPDTPAPVPPPAPMTAPPRAPSMPAPALDLSTPPDLSDLRAIQRN